MTRRAGRPFTMDETTDNDEVKETRRVDDARDDADLSGNVGEAQRPPGDATGVPQLDQVLGGGIPRGSLLMVVGPPGSGKTTLATQIAFASARAGRGALILTAFSEPASKLIAHLRAFRFFDEALVGGPVRILSLEQFLRGGNLTTLAPELLAMAREARAGLVLLDGFGGVRGLEGGAQAARQFLYDVGGQLSARGTTTLITSAADPHDPTFFPEATVSDTIIGLHYRLDGVRPRRGIEVIKVRGAAPLPGLHSLVLGDDGAVVYPRLEARVAAEGQGAVAAASTTRVSCGIPELDALLGGGLTRATTTVVAGSIGVGKTLLGLHFAQAGLQAGEPVVFAGFRETPGQLLLKADLLVDGTRIHTALEPGGALTLVQWAPIELDPDIVANDLLAALDQTGARRLVLDSVAELERAVGSSDPRRVDEYLAALVVALRARGVTTLAIKETRQTLVDAPEYLADPMSLIADNVIVLQQVVRDDRMRRTLAVVKMRFSAHEVAFHEYRIAAPHGLEVRAAFPDAPVDASASVTGDAREERESGQ